MRFNKRLCPIGSDVRAFIEFKIDNISTNKQTELKTIKDTMSLKKAFYYFLICYYLAYCFYLPLAMLGPLITSKQFKVKSHQKKKPILPAKPRKTQKKNSDVNKKY